MKNIHIHYKVFTLFTTIAILGGCDFGHFHEGHPHPTQLVGEWKSGDGEEYIKIHKDFDVVIKNNHREYHCTVTGKGKKIFVDGEATVIPENPPHIETTGSLVLIENTKQTTFMIAWSDPVNSYRSFGLYENKCLSLYTYVGDPDAPKSFLVLQKKEDNEP